VAVGAEAQREMTRGRTGHPDYAPSAFSMSRAIDSGLSVGA
jgi:hypothetical protein